MKHFALSALSACLLLLSSCSGPSHEALMEQTTDQLTKVADTLESVKDKASWEAAKPKLDAVMTSIESIGKEVKALGEPDAETKKKLDEKMTKSMASFTQRMGAAMQKLMQVEGIGEDVQKFMTDFSKRMSAMK
ncbi:MAG: hypothetical protein H6832_12500 [Planctomycetes bacterium]|nr:hypothetical protein [Planctomycetota bacterium]MCB9919213.1 hypothetical protein [Planctomycetota bacterium]